MARFDEIELIKEPTANPPLLRPLPSVEEPVGPAAAGHEPGAPLLKRILAFLTDLSLLLALALALSPLLPQRGAFTDSLSAGWPAFAALAAFLLLLSWYYVVGSWIVWGRTVGGTIFDSRVVALDGSAPSVAAATRRWLWTGISLALLGLPFLIGLFGEKRTVAERMSGTRTVKA